MSTGFLNLKGLTSGSVGHQEATTISTKWDTFPSVRKDMDSLGFREPNPPHGEVPIVKATNLENVQSREYTTKYSQLVAWLSFGENHRGTLNAERLGTRNALRILSATIRRKAKQDHAAMGKEKGWKAYTPGELNDLVLVDVEYQKVLLRDQEISQKLEILEGYLKGISRAVALMSRNIELKKMELESTNRANAPRGPLGMRTLGQEPRRRPMSQSDPQFDPTFGGDEESDQEEETE